MNTRLQRVWRKFRNYRPSKSLWLGSCFVAAIAPMYLGFTTGAWVSAADAAAMEQRTRRHALNELIGDLCVENFFVGPNAVDKLIAFSRASTYRQWQAVKTEGWAATPGRHGRISGSISACVGALEAEAEAHLEES